MTLVIVPVQTPVSAEGTPSVDGRVSPGEYEGNVTFGDDAVTMLWSIVDDTVYIALEARTEGSIVLSISPDQGLHDGDTVVAWLEEDGTVEVRDCFCIDDRGRPVTDLERGGTSDILETQGSLREGITTLEMSRPIATEDPFDKPFPREGSVYLTWEVLDSRGMLGDVVASGTEVLSIDGTPYPPSIEPSQAVDGVVEEGEYPNEASFGDGHYVLHWEVDGDEARFGIVAQTAGWVAVGFEPTRRMLDADMWFGWDSGLTGAGALDAWSVGDFGPHPPDITLGGTSDILEYNVRESGGTTTFEFVRRLDTGDGRDNPLPAEGAVTIVWATSVSDVYSVKHDVKGTGSILMEGGGPPPPGEAEGIDGIVKDGEYDFSASFGGGDYRLHWKVTDDGIRLAVMARTEGWVALGIDPEDRMEGADMLLGWVDEDGPVVHDAYATGPTGPHPPDVGLGGTYDIVAYNATEEGGWTTLELIRPLVTGDAFDKEIVLDGSLRILWAMGDSDGFDDAHAERGTGTIEVRRGTSEETTSTPIYTYHMAAMALGILMALVAYAPIRLKGRFPEGAWFKHHQKLGVIASVTAVIGVVAAVDMVAQLDDGHLRAPHPYGGVVATTLVLATLGLGIVFLYSRAAKRRVRRPHIIAGYLAITLLLVVSLSGLLRLLELGWL